MLTDMFNPKRGSGFRTIVAMAALALMAGLLIYFFKDRPGAAPTLSKAKTPDKSHLVQTKEAQPGSEKEAEDFFNDTAAGPETGKERKILFYRNPMDPSIISSTPAKDEMGMDYLPVYEDEAKGQSDNGLADMAPVLLSQQGISLSGVMTAEALSEDFVKTIRTVGRVLADETKVHRVQVRVSGWVEELFVNYQGQTVAKGTKLLSIYSPELISSQEEYIGALNAYGRPESQAAAGDLKYLKTLLDAAEKRLRWFDVPESLIREIEKTRTVQRIITLQAPVSGVVTGKEVFAGQRVEPGMALFTLTDLSQIWVEADFYEYEAHQVKAGETAHLFSSYDPSLLLQGRVSYIYPYVNPESRTLRARMEFSNENLRLKPGMFVDVRLSLNLGKSVVIPDSAVMASGLRKIVFVNTRGGWFEPREVMTGAGSEGSVQVLSGVSEGERVAVKANFLLDSESRLQAIIQAAAKKQSQAKPDGDAK